MTVTTRRWPWAPLVVGLGGVWLILALSGTPVVDLAIYTLYAAGAVALPGTLLFRLLVGRSENLFTDVTWGAVVGLAYEILGWALFTALGINHVLILWPIAGVLLLLGLRAPRNRILAHASQPGTSRWLVWSTTAAVLSTTALHSLHFFRLNPYPVAGVDYFVDLPWHLGVAYEAQRSVIPTAPEVAAEGTLHYHFLADAHFGAAGLITHLPLEVILTRLFLPSLAALAIASTVALAYRLTASAPASGLAGLVVAAPTAGLAFWRPTLAMPVIYPDSPTAIYAAGTMALLAWLVVDALRGHRLTPGRAILGVSLLLLAIGSKPSVLMDLLAGLGLVALIQLVRYRRIPLAWIAIGAAFLGAIAISFPVFASPSGSTIRPLAVFGFSPSGDATAPRELVLAGLLKGFLLLIPALLVLTQARLRRTREVHFLLGIVIGGFAVSLLIAHPGTSQIYFWTAAIPFAAILATWPLAEVLDLGPGMRNAWLAYGAKVALLAGLVIVAISPNLTVGVLRTGFQGAFAVAVIAVVLGEGLRVRLAKRQLAGATVARLVAAACVAAIAVGTLASTVNHLVHRPAPVVTKPYRLAQLEGAAWVQQHVPTEALVATNDHCLNPSAPICDARSFWLSGFGGHRVLIEGYGVTPKQLALTGRDGRWAWQQPYHDAALLAANDATFTDPTPESVATLRAKGVTWLVADRRSGAPSAKLAAYADLLFQNDAVAVYELRVAG